ncbi:MAG: hypothetical protein CMA83_01320 [Euryarchaeota archaeon]|jgi:hypothetical protein|nr:hypothetical protein [Euryarchaeota archaeon]|tara:strand:- start:85 stop:339 length:255 start_codon:yes stop_codon:yes gene_type:complete
MEWISENILTLICMVCGALSTIVGGVWWMSALYSKVRQIHERVDEFVDDYKSSQARMWTAIQEIDVRLDDHSERLTRIESKVNQ